MSPARHLQMEEQIYTEECIPGIKIEYADNQGCIDLIEKAPSGIFKLLDSQCKTPKARHATSRFQEVVA